MTCIYASLVSSYLQCWSPTSIITYQWCKIIGRKEVVLSHKQVVWYYNNLDYQSLSIYYYINCSSDQAPNIELIEGPAGELLISIPISDVPEKLPQYYGFSKGRHSGSFFLKVGAAIFCAMHITHLCITIAKEVNVHWIENNSWHPNRHILHSFNNLIVFKQWNESDVNYFLYFRP